MKEITVKINKMKSQFFKKINKIHKPLTRINKKKKREESNEQNQKNKGEVTTDNAKILTIVRDYYERYVNKKFHNSYGNTKDPEQPRQS